MDEEGERTTGVCKSADPCLFSPNPSIRQYFCLNPKPQPHPEPEFKKFKGKLINVNTAIVNFAQIVKKFDDLYKHSTIPL